jgi:uncharacterized protein (TIGR03067 family)
MTDLPRDRSGRLLRGPVRACVLGLALFAGACGPAETGRTDGRAADAGTTGAVPRADKGRQPSQKGSSRSKDAGDEAARRELERLEGTWVAVGIEHDGGQDPAVGAAKWVIRNGRYGVYLDGQKRETWTLKLNPTRSPKTVEARLVIDQTGQRLAGIYELDGDTLKVCYDLTGRDFPAEFSAPKGARRVNYVFRRE